MSWGPESRATQGCLLGVGRDACGITIALDGEREITFLCFWDLVRNLLLLIGNIASLRRIFGRFLVFKSDAPKYA